MPCLICLANSGILPHLTPRLFKLFKLLRPPISPALRFKHDKMPLLLEGFLQTHPGRKISRESFYFMKVNITNLIYKINVIS
jgi:hypothetical protein